MNLLGGAPYILESPIEQRAANAAIGSQAANNFLGNYWKGFAASVDERRWKEQEPLRDAQLSSAVANAEFDTTRAQMAALEAAQRSKAAVAMTDFFALKEQISDGGWEPKDRAVFYNFLSRHPEVGQTREAAEMERAFEVSDAARARLAEVNTKYGMSGDGQLIFQTDPSTGKRFWFSGTNWHILEDDADPVAVAAAKQKADGVVRDVTLTADEKMAKIDAIYSKVGVKKVDGPPVAAQNSDAEELGWDKNGRLRPVSPHPAISPVPDVGIVPAGSFLDNLNRGIDFSR